MLNENNRDTVYLLNNVFITINDIKKQRLGNWKELINLYSHKDSNAIIQKMAFEFMDITSEIYEKLILKGIEEGLFNPSSPKSPASMWCNEVTRLYQKINQIVLDKGNKTLYDEFLENAQFAEDIINFALNAPKKMIEIKKPIVEYLNMVIEMMNKV